MASPKDPYSVLGVSRSATPDEVRKAYRKLAHKYHPDKNPGDKQAEERFKEVSVANDVLSDPERRKLYDEFGDDALRGGFDPAQARAHAEWARQHAGRRGYAASGMPFEQGFGSGAPFGGAGVDFDLSDLFGDILGRGRGGERHSARPRDIHAEVQIDLIEAIRGKEVRLAIPGVDEPVTVRIPKGADDGSKLRVSGQGAPGPGGKRGDIVIETRVRPHRFFRRQGLDLHLKLPVTIDEAYNGGQVPVPTPEGQVSLKVPARSQQGATLRLKGKGIERAGLRGDLYVELDVRLPDKDNEEFSAAAKTVSASYAGALRADLAL